MFFAGHIIFLITLLVQQGSSGFEVNCVFYGKNMTFCIVLLYTMRFIL